MKPSAKDSMGLRLATAFALIPVLIAIVWLPSLRWVFAAVVMLLAGVGAYEFFGMARQVGIDAAARAGVILAPLLALSAGLTAETGYGSHAALLVAVFIMIAVHLFSLRHTIAGLSTSVFGLMYAGYCGSYFVAMNQIPHIGPGLITLLVTSIGFSDTGAYCIGKTLGRHKLAPKVSPNKTIEGSAAALVSAAIASAALFGLKEGLGWESYPAWSLPVYMCVGVCLSIVGQLGDLVESLLKRNAGVKDSGSLFPGHGGVLDRCDAFLFGGPTLYYLNHLIDAWRG